MSIRFDTRTNIYLMLIRTIDYIDLLRNNWYQIWKVTHGVQHQGNYLHLLEPWFSK